MFIWDSFIFTLTVVKTYRERFQYTALVGANNLLTLIVRDGAWRAHPAVPRATLTVCTGAVYFA